MNKVSKNVLLVGGGAVVLLILIIIAVVWATNTGSPDTENYNFTALASPAPTVAAVATPTMMPASTQILPGKVWLAGVFDEDTSELVFTNQNAPTTPTITGVCMNPTWDYPPKDHLYTLNDYGVLVPTEEFEGQYQRFLVIK